MVIITLPDASQRGLGQPSADGRGHLGHGDGAGELAFGGRVGQGDRSRLVDISHRIEADESLAIVTDKSADGLALIRHSTAHLLAYAVKDLFPEAQVTIGPVIENGFFYDFAYKRPFTTEDLVAIEARMTAKS